jgi:signal transduction histidine kinase
MPASARGRALLAAGLVLLLFLAGLGSVALRSLERRSARVLHQVESDAAERGARQAAWDVLAGLAPDSLREALAQAEPRVALSRQLKLWHTTISMDMIVFDATGAPLAAAPSELLEQSPRLSGYPPVLLFQAGSSEPERGPLNDQQLDITHADGTAAATLSALPTGALGEAPPPPEVLQLFDPLLLSFLAAITLAVLALLAFLVRTTNRLERAEALRRALVADAGHELRTPLTNLRCQLEAAQDGLSPLTPPVLRSLHDETMLLVRLVDDLRDLAAAEAGELGLRRRPTAFAEVAARTAVAMQAAFDASGVALQVDAPTSLPPLDADGDRLGQVLRNLLDNARRHTPPGGHVRLAARAVGAALELDVSDTGLGIRPDVLGRVFERGACDSRGSGLGLAIVRSLVAAHGGTVNVASHPGAGACFTVRWPLAGAEREGGASGARPAGPSLTSPVA